MRLLQRGIAEMAFVQALHRAHVLGATAGKPTRAPGRENDMTIETMGKMPTQRDIQATIAEAEQMRAEHIRTLAQSLAARLRRAFGGRSGLGRTA